MRKPAYKKVYGKCGDGAERAEMADQEWAGILEELEARGNLTEQRKRIADRLVRDRVEYAFLYPVVAENGPVIKGPNDGDLFSFHWSALQKLKDQILKLEEALKLTVQKGAEVRKEDKPKTAADKYLAKAEARPN